MLDDLLVGSRGARVRCTECGTVFRVMPGASSLAELGAALPDEPWRVTQQDGGTLHFASVSDLSRAILAGFVEANDMLSHGMLPARRLGEVLELTSFFARARRPPADERIPTLPGLVDPAQRAAVEHARAEIERLQREAAAGAERAAAPPTVPAPLVAEQAPPTEPTPSPILVTGQAPEAATYAMTPDEGTPAPAHVELDSSPHQRVAVPEAAVSPPQLPALDDEPDTDPTDRQDVSVPPRRSSAERQQDARRARLVTGVVSALAAAALVLVAGLGAKAYRTHAAASARQNARSIPPPAASAVPVVVAHVPPPEPPPAVASVAPDRAPTPSAAPSAEYHRGDPEHLPPVDPRRMVADGAHALRHGDLGKAETAFQRALDKNPYDSEALSGLADLARVRGQHDRSRELYAQALSVNPNYLPALLALADLAWSSGDKDEARKGYEHIIQHYPQSAYPGRVKKRVEEGAP